MNVYLEAAAIIQSKQTSSLKSLIYHPVKPLSSPPARLYALIVETLKFQDILNEVIRNAGLLAAEKKVSTTLPSNRSLYYFLPFTQSILEL